jgi:hypothetical protein
MVKHFEPAEKFCLQSPYCGREILSAENGARALGINCVRSVLPIDGFIPVGTVEYCAPVFGKEPKIKNFYPDFLANYITREINLVCSQTSSDCFFAKNATEWKSDHPKFVKEVSGESLWWVSDLVRFTQEWRYYIADGCLITAGWYDGDNQDEPAPQLDIKWPSGFSGAVDFGRLSSGQIELVEAHAPYGCGWYGETRENELYALWLYESWNHRSFWLQ